jgi:excisionase family DNA binding protein
MFLSKNYHRIRKGVMGVDVLLTAEEVAQVLRMHERTVRRLATKDEIPGARRVGREWRFIRTEIEKFIGEALPKNQAGKALE